MTPAQIGSLCFLAAVAAWLYWPSIVAVFPKKTPSILGQIEDVISIRDSHRDEEVTKACNALLAVLLRVSK